MSGGDIAGLIAAGVFALLVLLLAVPILKLGRVFDEVRTSIRSISGRVLTIRSAVSAERISDSAPRTSKLGKDLSASSSGHRSPPVSLPGTRKGSAIEPS